jgi:SAM-dependent methyltransferase
MPEVEYILGHSDAELRRLAFQASILKPITVRLLREAGISPGMRVLDIGSGSGDVAMLAADLVGPEGTVVGVDRSHEALTVARERAELWGHTNIAFVEGAVEDLADRTEFDLAIGRYVLIHQADPAAMIRAAAEHVRPGGTIAFHEFANYGEPQSLPPVPLWTEVVGWIIEALSSVMTHPDAGGRMMTHFRDAGLPPPSMFCEVPVGGGREGAHYAWVALSVRNLLPQMEKIGLATPEEVDIDTLEERLRDAVAAAQAQVLCPMQFCGWSRCGSTAA